MPFNCVYEFTKLQFIGINIANLQQDTDFFTDKSHKRLEDLRKIRILGKNRRDHESYTYRGHRICG